MITHKYIDHSRFFPGLPAQDLDIATLNDEQKAMLILAMGLGVYKPVGASAPPPTPPSDSPKKKGDS